MNTFFLQRRVLAAALLGIGIGSFSLPGHTIGLGAAQVRSGIGQPLRVKVPVRANMSELTGGAACFRLMQSPHHSGTDLPTLNRADLKLIQSPQGSYLMVTTAYPVNDPILDFSLESVCDNAFRRDYTILIDTVQRLAEETNVPAVVAAPLPRQAKLNARNDTVAAPAKRARKRRAPVHHASHRLLEIDAGMPAKKSAPELSAKAAPVSAPAVTPAAGEHVSLRISTSLGTWPQQQGSVAAGPLNSDIRFAQEDALQDDIVALQKQLAETKAAVVVLRKQISAMTVLPAATTTAKKPAHDSVPWLNWFLYPAGGLMTGTAVLYLLRKYRHTNEPEVSEMHADQTSVGTAEQWTEPSWAKLEAQQPVGSDKIDRKIQPTVVTPSQVPVTPVATLHAGRKEEDFLVSTVNQITEEATVFADLGYPERAMTLLTEHIASHERSHPAVWYLLFELYRNNGLQAEFEQAQITFKRRFNLAAPRWQDSAESVVDTVGILSFPHVLECTARLWPTNDCRTYLESLLYDDRGGEREGFSHHTYQDLLFLIGLLEHELELVQAVEAGEAKSKPALPESRLRLIQGRGF